MTKQEKLFIQTVQEFYKEQGRHTLPWRKTQNSYEIHVSEVMLQQTQVDRVLPKYTEFIKHFPDVQRLASASLGEVLIQWQGLGYNRRAQMLHTCAQEIQTVYNGTYPRDYHALVDLSGIGCYTAGAILAFAYNIPVPIIETNIRTAYIHHFFGNETNISDKEILRLIAVTLDTKNPRRWYWALMDYGSFLKKKYGTLNSQSKHYTKQSRFEGSNRQIRGAIIRSFTEEPYPCSKSMLLRKLSNFEGIRVYGQLNQLLKEGIVVKTKNGYHLPNGTR